MANYFTEETDAALTEWINCEDQEQKNVIFEKRIRPAFDKLIENLIYVYGFFSLGDVEGLKKEALANLYEMIPKFDPTKGTKGFSYFNVVAKNWFIAKTREKSKRHKQESELNHDLDHEAVKNDPNFAVSPFEALVIDKERWLKFYSAMESWRDELKKKPELQVLEAVIFLMRNPELVTIYNKKAVYLYLREMTGLNTKQVVVALKKIKELYDEWNDSYSDSGENVA